MTDKILLKRSLVSGSIPTTASLEVGELAINVHDAAVYLKQSGSGQEVIRPLLTLDTDSTGDVLLTGSITTTEDVTAPNFIGDLLGTSSFALTASYAENAEGSGFPFEGDAVITGSLTVSGSFIDFTETTGISGSVFTGSFVGDGTGLTGVTTTIEQISAVAFSFTDETVIVVSHNLNTSSPIVQVYDENDEQIIPQVVKIVNENTVRVEFPISTSGKIVIAKGGHIVVLEELTGSFSGSFTGSLQGDAETAQTASFALSVSGSGGRVLYNDNDNNTVTSENLEFDGTNLTVGGQLSASVKSFVIKHQTKPGKKLVYGVSEGPEHSVFVRGKLDDTNTIYLPEEWEWLVDMDTITVQLTPIGKHQKLYVEDIEGLEIKVGNENLMSKSVKCFYLVHGTRKDIEPLETVI